MAIFNKQKAVSELCESMKAFTEAKFADFSRLCSRLLNESFIYGQLSEDSKDYWRILELKSEITDYFSLMDYSLVYDDTFKIIYIQSLPGRSTLKLHKLETVILLILRLQYYKLSQNTGNVNIVTTVGDLSTELDRTGIYKQSINKSNLIDSLSLLRRHKVIDFDTGEMTTETVIRIFPTILHILDNNSLESLQSTIDAYKKVRDDDEII